MHSALALMLTAAPLSAIAGMGAEENINIYGWQNWSYEFVDADGDEGREYDRLSNNAANIGFMAHMDTGVDGLQVGFRCEQFTYWGRNNSATDWCNRNSKISLRHETLGEIMFGQWLLPYNEIVAAWIDPFYDAGATSHTSIMGNFGTGTSAGFYNGSFDADDLSGELGALTFNRRQEGIVQYVWPNTSAMADQSRDGFQFRFAVTQGNATDTPSDKGTQDPRIWSAGVSWQQNLANNGQVWLAAAYEQHDDIWSGGQIEGLNCEDSDDEAFRLAGRYIHDWGNGQRTQLGTMYEEMETEADACDYDAETELGPYTLIGNDVALFVRDPTAFGAGVNHDLGVERDAWMISGKHSFGNGFDFRFSYMDADDWECVTGGCTAAIESNTAADAYNLGLFYTMPAGTELRLTYSEVDNDDLSAYDFGINAGGSQLGEDIEQVGVGIVHWFD